MNKPLPHNVFDLPGMRARRNVFDDRIRAGECLAVMLETHAKQNSIVFAIPAGGVPVAAAIASRLKLAFDVAVVSKITLPWDTEAGYGALAFDGTLRLNDALVNQLDLNEAQIQEGIRKTRAKVSGRVKKLRGVRPFPDVKQQTVIVVDDGLASGFTMQVAIEALQKADAQHIIVAVPTGHENAVRRLSAKVEAVFCPNIRGGWYFAVADAYRQWADVDEDEALKLVTQLINI